MDKDEKSYEIQKMAKKIFESIAQYFCNEIIHSIRRLLPAEIKNIYVGPLQGISTAYSLIFLIYTIV